MNQFDDAARTWDQNSIHTERSQAIANVLQKNITLNKNMKVLEYGAGTGILSFLLHDKVQEITMMDSSQEMVNVMNEKVSQTGATNLKPLMFDLEHQDFLATFDLIFNQMVMHHVKDVDRMLQKFHKLLNPEGYLVIADLYTEDGSFHGPEADVHKGFDPYKLSETLQSLGLTNIKHETCFEILRESSKKYPVFLLMAQKV
jgi:2-polyprenyl-3-methyl-5-hydroxy-6-metoxy-1,4-benzoquinol methylase